MAVVGIFTVGLQKWACPSFPGEATSQLLFPNLTTVYQDGVKINGMVYNATLLNQTLILSQFQPFSIDWINQNLNTGFSSPCSGFVVSTKDFCVIQSIFPNSSSFPSDGNCIPISVVSNLQPIAKLSVDWTQVDSRQNMLVFSGSVLNLTRFFSSVQAGVWNISPTLLNTLKENLGGDATYALVSSYSNTALMQCLRHRYTVAYIGSQSFGCSLYSLLTTLALTTVLGLIFVRFIMALLFHWFVAPKQARSSSSKIFLERKALDTNLHTICLVTCYSEGQDAIKVFIILILRVP